MKYVFIILMTFWPYATLQTVKQTVPPLSNNCLNPDQAQQCVRPDLRPNCLLNILFISRQH